MGSHHHQYDVHGYPAPWPGVLLSALQLYDTPSFCFFFCGHYNVSEVSALNSVRPRKERRSLSKGWGKRSRSTTSPSLPCFSSPLAIQALLRKQSYSFFTGFLLYTMTAFS